MRFAPKTQKEIDEEGLMPEGEYEATVVGSVEKESSAGNEMIELTLKVHAPDGDRQIKDWLLEKVAYKLRHFCEATGNMQKYEAGTLTDDDCRGHVVKVSIGIKPASGEYRAANAVKDYRAIERATAARTAAAPHPSKIRGAVASSKTPTVSPEDIPF